MKKTINILFLVLTLSLSSCSTYVERFPAAEESEIFTEAFSFMPSGNLSKTDLGEEALKNMQAYTGDVHEARRVDIEKVKSLPNGALFKVELVKDPKNSLMLIFKIQATSKAFKDSGASSAMMNFVMRLLQKAELGTTYATFEMYYNARAGDPIALENFIKLKGSEPYMGIQGHEDHYVFSDDYKKYRADIVTLKEKLSDDIKKLKKTREATSAKRKAPLDALDKAPEGKQFRALVAKGDRKGAMTVLRKYLPWEDMAPFEKQFWENYIEITENPVPLEQRVIIYRGLDEDYINRGIVGGKELTEKEAIKTDNAFIMSSGMVKNQGSWNRRLRSLEAMNKKFIATVNQEDEYAQSARISVMFKNHSAEPKGSPFISFTPSASVAEGFGGQRTSAYLIDPRLLNFNYASTYDTEFEYLLPLSTFPDDLIAIADTDMIYADEKIVEKNRETYLANKLEQLITKKYGEAKKDKILAQIRKNSYDFFKLQYADAKPVTAPGVPAENQKFYKGFLGKDDPKPAMKPNGELTCKDLIELFWMAK